MTKLDVDVTAFNQKLNEKIADIGLEYGQELVRNIYLEECADSSTYNPSTKICEEKDVS